VPKCAATLLKFVFEGPILLSRAHSARRGPPFDSGQEFTLRHGYRRTAFAGVPSPEYERRGHVFDDLLDGAMPVLVRVFEQLTELAVGEPFPDHGRFRRRKAPVQSARRCVQADGLAFLMAATALDAIHSLAVGSATDVHGMRVAVVSLAGKVAGGMAIHAARIPQHGNDGLECRGCSRVFCLCGCGGYQGTGQENVNARLHALAIPSAALTRSGVNGKSRRRAPVASKIALPMAAGATVIAVSPAPVAATPFGVTKTVLMVGIS
jgi:hypothetical protein